MIGSHQYQNVSTEETKFPNKEIKRSTQETILLEPQITLEVRMVYLFALYAKQK